MSSQIHWFPGHMKKALNEIANRIKVVDVVIELFDARAPFSSINEELETVIKDKKKIIILSKPDLADQNQTKKWKEHFKSRFDLVLALDLTKPSANKDIADAVFKLGEEKRMKDKKRGMKPQPIRTMIIGIPNVGKSSLINRLASRRAAGVQNKPGYTRGEQWIKVNKDFDLLDTPGVLPMAYENKHKAAKLALIGAIREDILPISDLADYLIKFLKQFYPNSLKDRFGIENITETIDVLKAIATKRSCMKAGELDIEKAESILLKEFKDGKLGKITLEWTECLI
jgi:ribosome biogenesis GTPase A